MAHITKVISTLPPAPKRNFDEQAVFVDKAERMFDALETMTGELNAYGSQANIVRDEINTFQSTASTKASEASLSATNAKTSETNAKLSENAAKLSETNAKDSENEAKLSETNAKDSETNALISETNAKTSETNAKTSETNAYNAQLASEIARDEVVAVVATIPDGTINDIITTSMDTWSSQKVSDELDLKIDVVDIVNNLTSTDTNKPLSANQGKVLKGLIDSINTILNSDETNLDTIQEIVDFIKINRDTLNTLTINSIAGLQNALDNKLNQNQNAISATKLQTARTIGGVSFDGTANINLPGVNTAGNQNTTGNAASATKLQTAKTINGVAFDGSANITVVDSTKVALTGNETIAGTKTFSSNIVGSITGNSATTTALANARTINGVSFNGTANITISDNTKLTKANPAITGSITEQVYNLTGTSINPANGTIQYKTVSANTTFTVTMSAGQSVILRLVNANSYTITFPAITWVGVTAPVLMANCVIVLWKEQSALYGAYVGSLV